MKELGVTTSCVWMMEGRDSNDDENDYGWKNQMYLRRSILHSAYGRKTEKTKIRIEGSSRYL
jgi:hypothetical protein